MGFLEGWERDEEGWGFRDWDLPYQKKKNVSERNGFSTRWKDKNHFSKEYLALGTGIPERTTTFRELRRSSFPSIFRQRQQIWRCEFFYIYTPSSFSCIFILSLLILFSMVCMWSKGMKNLFFRDFISFTISLFFFVFVVGLLLFYGIWLK